MFSIKPGIAFITLIVLFTVTGCGDSNDDAAAKSTAMPKIIKDVDDALSKPYDAHFQDVQGDYAVAMQIGGKIQKVVDQADQMSTRHIMGLVQTASALEGNPSKLNYTDLVNEWNSVRDKIKLRQ